MKRRKLKLNFLQEAARAATQAALVDFGGYVTPPADRLTLGTSWEGDATIFELYVVGERPEDAIVLTTTSVNSYSGEVISVHIHEKAWAVIAQQSIQADAFGAA